MRYALTGSLRRAGTAVQINAQFASTDSGAVLWSERFDYPSDADWAWQRDISQRIARALDVKLADAAAVARSRRQAELIDAVMQGQHLMRRSTAPADILRARGHFEAALQIDPDSVNALCGLAQTYISQRRGLWSDDRGRPSRAGRTRRRTRARAGAGRADGDVHARPRAGDARPA